MPDKKLKLPAEIAKNVGMAAVSPALPVVDTGIQATREIVQAKIEANAKVEVAKLQVWKEAIAATKGFFKVLESHKELQATQEEWKGRIVVAENSVKKAEIDLQAAQEHNKLQMEELNLSREALVPLLSLFDDGMKVIKDANLSDDVKNEARQHLLQLAELIVQSKK